jgi:hypothetical protein
VVYSIFALAARTKQCCLNFITFGAFSINVYTLRTIYMAVYALSI